MVHIKPQFTNLLASITIALAAISTVDARPQDNLPASIDSSPPDIGIDLARKAPLMRRGGGGSGASRARMARQLEAAALFEASRLAHAKERRARAAKVRSSDDPGKPVSAGSIEVKRDHRHHHHHHHGHHHGHHHHHHHGSHHHHTHGHHDGTGTKVYADDPLIISGDHNHVHSHSHKRDRTVVDADDPVVITGDGNHVHTHSHGGHHHHKSESHHHGHHKHHHHHHAHDRETTVLADSPLIVSGEGNHVHSHSHKRHHPDGHSKGGHSEHWFEHHGPKAESHHHRHHGHHHHHHHHHHHGKRSRPNRLSDHEADTFIAPPSARPVVEGDQLSKVKSKASEDGTGGKMVKRPKSQSGDGKASGHEKDWDESDSDDEDKKGHKKWDKRDEGSIGSGTEPSEPNATGPNDNNQTASGISGVIDLMRGWPDGEKVGGLSISAFPNDTANGASIHNSTSISVLIDSTPNLSEQTTFFMHELEDQSLLDSEHPTTRAVRDLLVSLEIPYTPNMTDPEAPPSEELRMCATFNPLEPAVQTFGLALCMDQDSATNDRRMSQAFRYSSDTGVLQPYYGAGGKRQTVLAAVNKRIAEMDSGEGEQTGWTGTGVYDLDPNVATPPGFEPNSTDSNTLEPNPFAAELNSTVPISLAPSSMLDPLSAPLPGTNATDDQDSAPTSDAAPTPLLAARHTRRALIIGASPEVEMASSVDMPVIMVFRSDDETWRHTKDDVEMMEEPDKVSGKHQEVKLTHPEAVDKPKDTDAASSKTSNSDGKKKSFDSTDPEDEAPVHKPVAFFAESGRSAPVPPEDQADIVHPILLADPGSIRPSPKLAIADPKEPNAEEEDVTPVFLSAPSHENSPPGVMATVPEPKVGPMGIPIDASD